MIHWYLFGVNMSKDIEYYDPLVLEQSVNKMTLSAEQRIKQAFKLSDGSIQTLYTLKSKSGNALILTFVNYKTFCENKAIFNAVFNKIQASAIKETTPIIYNCVFVIDEMSAEDFKLIISEFFAEKSMSRRIMHKYLFPSLIIQHKIVKFELNKFVFDNTLERSDHLAYKRESTKFTANLTID